MFVIISLVLREFRFLLSLCPTFVFDPKRSSRWMSLKSTEHSDFHQTKHIHWWRISVIFKHKSMTYFYNLDYSKVRHIFDCTDNYISHFQNYRNTQICITLTDLRFYWYYSFGSDYITGTVETMINIQNLLALVIQLMLVMCCLMNVISRVVSKLYKHNIKIYIVRIYIFFTCYQKKYKIDIL